MSTIILYFLDPPSYEEAMIDQRMEEDFEDWDYTKEFAPKYPVYNFNKKWIKPNIKWDQNIFFIILGKNHEGFGTNLGYIPHQIE